MKGDLYDLTNKFKEDMSVPKNLSKVTLDITSTLEKNNFRFTRVGFSTHTGTHIDAPCHCVKNGHAIDEIPLKKFFGRGVVIDARVGKHGVITLDLVKNSGFEIRENDFVFFYTGAQEYFEKDDPLFYEGASLSPELARWLVERKVTLVGTDLSTVDIASSLRDKDFNAPIHHILLENNVYISECLKLDEVVGKELQVYAFPMLIEGIDGSPLRCIAVEI